MYDFLFYVLWKSNSIVSLFLSKNQKAIKQTPHCFCLIFDWTCAVYNIFSVSYFDKGLFLCTWITLKKNKKIKKSSKEIKTNTVLGWTFVYWKCVVCDILAVFLESPLLFLHINYSRTYYNSHAKKQSPTLTLCLNSP